MSLITKEWEREQLNSQAENFLEISLKNNWVESTATVGLPVFKTRLPTKYKM